MNSIINLNYRGNSLPIKEVDGTPWVNLNAMGRPFGKEPGQWIRSDAAKEYILAVETLDFDENKQDAKKHSGEISSKKAITIQHGGKNPGTWAHELVALEFARHCDASFAVWCNNKLRTLLLDGKVEIDKKAESLILSWNQCIMMAMNGQKWGYKFKTFLAECNNDRDRYIKMIHKFFNAVKGDYEFKKDIIHKMRSNFKTYKEERLSGKSSALDIALMLDIERELENMWARFEAHSTGQSKRQANALSFNYTEFVDSNDNTDTF